MKKLATKSPTVKVSRNGTTRLKIPKQHINFTSKKSITDEYVCLMLSVSSPDEELFRNIHSTLFACERKEKSDKAVEKI
ncbi:MAG: hypothetical protein ACJ72Z_05030 [Pyrinomonadaceae bacterium]